MLNQLDATAPAPVSIDLTSVDEFDCIVISSGDHSLSSSRSIPAIVTPSAESSCASSPRSIPEDGDYGRV